MRRPPPPRARSLLLAGTLAGILAVATACGSGSPDEQNAEPDASTTVTVTAEPSAAGSPQPSAIPVEPSPPPPTRTAPKPTPVDLSAYETPGFSTPSGNIGCLFDDYGGAHVRCDRLAMDGVPSRKPADCDFDWGHSVELYAGDRAALACTSDSVMGIQGETDGTRALPYGDSVRYHRIVCTSTKKGLSCTSGGHGFLISRATITVT